MYGAARRVTSRNDVFSPTMTKTCEARGTPSELAAEPCRPCWETTSVVGPVAPAALEPLPSTAALSSRTNPARPARVDFCEVFT